MCSLGAAPASRPATQRPSGLTATLEDSTAVAVTACPARNGTPPVSDNTLCSLPRRAVRACAILLPPNCWSSSSSNPPTSMLSSASTASSKLSWGSTAGFAATPCLSLIWPACRPARSARAAIFWFVLST